MALTTAEQNDINTMCSQAKGYSIGSRLKYMTTAGNVDGAELTNCSDIEMVSYNPPAATGSNASGYWATAAGITVGNWETTWAYVYITTSPSTGDVITITNNSSNTTVIVEFSSAGDADVTYIGYTTSNRIATIPISKTISMYCRSATNWQPLCATEQFSSWGVASA